MKKSLIFFGIILIAAAGAGVWFYEVGCTDDWCRITPGQKLRAINSFGDCVLHGYPVAESYPRQCKAGDKVFTEDITAQQNNNIIIAEPRPNDEVSIPLSLRGQARVFENQFSWRIKDSDGSVLVEGTGTAASPDIGRYGPFSVAISYPEPKGSEGIVQVFVYSAKDGSETDVVSIPVRFKKVETTTVKVFFGNSKNDPGSSRCDIVYPVTRRVAQTFTPAQAAMDELLAGPNLTEAKDGYLSLLPTGVKLRRLAINKGVATVDFSAELNAAAGSCLVTTVRAQIEQTLKQFSTVQEVIISVDGKTEGNLQP